MPTILLAVLAFCSVFASPSFAQTICPGCAYIPPTLVNAMVPGVMLTLTAHPLESGPGVCVLNGDDQCVPSGTPCTSSWFLDIVIANPAPPGPMPPVELTVGDTTSLLAWDPNSTLLVGRAHVWADHGLIPCGVSYRGTLTFAGVWLGTLEVGCEDCG